jgi:hypothetical protein
VQRGRVLWRRADPGELARRAAGDAELIEALQAAWPADLRRFEPQNYFLLRRGPYRIAAGLDESPVPTPRTLRGRFINLFDPALRLRGEIVLSPGSRWFLLDLDALTDTTPQVLAAACKCRMAEQTANRLTIHIEGVQGTQARLLLSSRRPPWAITLNGQPLTIREYDAVHGLVWIGFANEAQLRTLVVHLGG